MTGEPYWGRVVRDLTGPGTLSERGLLLSDAAFQRSVGDVDVVRGERAGSAEPCGCRGNFLNLCVAAGTLALEILDVDNFGE
jgi:hypothetical protein